MSRGYLSSLLDIGGSVVGSAYFSPVGLLRISAGTDILPISSTEAAVTNQLRDRFVWHLDRDNDAQALQNERTDGAEFFRFPEFRRKSVDRPMMVKVSDGHRAS